MGSFCDHYSHRSNSREGGNKQVGSSKVVIRINKHGFENKRGQDPKVVKSIIDKRKGGF